METSSKQPNFKRILLIRLSALGDVAMLPHAVRAFREAYPKVGVTILTRSFLRPLFDGLDVEFIFVDTDKHHRGFWGLWRLAGEIKAHGVDAVADVHGMIRSSILRWMCFLRGGIPFRKIYKGRVEKWFRVGYSNHEAVPLTHSVVRYCDVLRRFGYTFDDPSPAKRVVHESPVGKKSGRWVGFAPFSAHRGKTYPADLSEQVVGLLSERFDRVFIHSGGGSEAEFAERMESQYPNVTALWDRVKLKEERDLISNLDCVITMDSLVMHLAALVATPTVSVWGATHPEFGFMGYGMDYEGVLQEDMPCRPCSVYGNKPCKSGDYKCLRAITPEMIVERAEYMCSKYGFVECSVDEQSE